MHKMLIQATCSLFLFTSQSPSFAGNLDSLFSAAKKGGSTIASDQLDKIYQAYCSALFRAQIYSGKPAAKGWVRSLYKYEQLPESAQKELSLAKQYRDRLISICGQKAVLAAESNLRYPNPDSKYRILAK